MTVKSDSDEDDTTTLNSKLNINKVADNDASKEVTASGLLSKRKRILLKVQMTIHYSPTQSTFI